MKELAKHQDVESSLQRDQEENTFPTDADRRDERRLNRIADVTIEDIM